MNINTDPMNIKNIVQNLPTSKKTDFLMRRYNTPNGIVNNAESNWTDDNLVDGRDWRRLDAVWKNPIKNRYDMGNVGFNVCVYIFSSIP